MLPTPISLSSPLDTSFAFFLQELPVEYHDLAIEFKAFARARKIKSPSDLMRLVMSYCGIDFSLRTVAGHFTLWSEKISDTAVHNRLKACAPWIKAVLGKVLQIDMEGDVPGGLRFVVIDASTVQAPGATGTSYRLHFAVDLLKVELLHAEITDAHVGESLMNFPLREGDVVVVDRGYNQPGALIEQSKRGVSVVLRYNPHGMTLRDKEMNKIDWRKIVTEADGQVTCTPARATKGSEYVDGYVHAIPLPPVKAAEARRRARQNSQKKGATIRDDTLFLAGWVMIFTTIEPQILNTEMIAKLYRVRWQIELVIKRLKSLLDIDHLRAHEGGELAKLYLHGKILYAAIVEKYIWKCFGTPGFWLDGNRSQTPWRPMALICEKVKSWIVDASPMDIQRFADCLDTMRERARRRSLQTLPIRILELIDKFSIQKDSSGEKYVLSAR